MAELYAYEKYKGYNLFVEHLETYDEDYGKYEGVAQLNGTTIFTASSVFGDGVIKDLQRQINNELRDDLDLPGHKG